MQARYQDPAVSQFISIDPASRDNTEKFIDDPQQLNSYAYSRNNPLYYVDPDGTKITVYIESGKISDGVKAVFGHSFLDINGVTYSWAPGEGAAINDNTYGADLGIVSTKYYLMKDNKDNDKYTTYTFDTTIEQENKIKNYYNYLIEINTNNPKEDDIVFSNLSYNCTDVVVAALKNGGVVSHDFNLGIIQTPGELKSRLEKKYHSQSSNRLHQKVSNWLNGQKNSQIMTIEDKKIINTKSN